MDFPLTLYYDKEISSVEELDLCRGDDDFRKVFIVDDGKNKLVIKYLSNTFSDRRRIEGWFALMDEYRKTGIYVPKIIPNRYCELLHCDIFDGREYYVYAEEYAIYETAEKSTSTPDRSRYIPDVLRLLGRIASAKLDILDWPSAYCLLEPFCPPDTTDEATEAATAFVQFVKENIPTHLSRAKALLKMFYERQNEVRNIYSTLPTSCFQADLNSSNILLDEKGEFAGLIDFNLCGREPILNYAIREAFLAVKDSRLYGENESCLYIYDKELNTLRNELFLKNMGYIQETYTFNEDERKAFPVLLRYMNSFWWAHLTEIKKIRSDDKKINKLFDWLELQMTRDDIRLL